MELWDGVDTPETEGNPLLRVRATRKTAEESYNGWTNWETWSVVAQFDNDPFLYSETAGVTDPGFLEAVWNTYDEYGESGVDSSKVNWQEIANSRGDGYTASRRIRATRRAATDRPTEGVTRCACGAKYWDGDKCASCGDKYRKQSRRRVAGWMVEIPSGLSEKWAWPSGPYSTEEEAQRVADRMRSRMPNIEITVRKEGGRRKVAYQSSGSWLGEHWHIIWHGEYGDGADWAIYADIYHDDEPLEEGFVEGAQSLPRAQAAVADALARHGLPGDPYNLDGSSSTQRMVGSRSARRKVAALNFANMKSGDKEVITQIGDTGANLSVHVWYDGFDARGDSGALTGEQGGEWTCSVTASDDPSWTGYGTGEPRSLARLVFRFVEAKRRNEIASYVADWVRSVMAASKFADGPYGVSIPGSPAASRTGTRRRAAYGQDTFPGMEGMGASPPPVPDTTPRTVKFSGTIVRMPEDPEDDSGDNYVTEDGWLQSGYPGMVFDDNPTVYTWEPDSGQSAGEWLAEMVNSEVGPVDNVEPDVNGATFYGADAQTLSYQTGDWMTTAAHAEGFTDDEIDEAVRILGVR
jgi:hypothetical protein